MGRADPYRDRPWVTTDWPLDKIDDNWSLIVTCGNCSHIRTLGRVKRIPNARKFKTTRQLQAHLRCLKCGAKRASLTVEFVGLKRD